MSPRNLIVTGADYMKVLECNKRAKKITILYHKMEKEELYEMKKNSDIKYKGTKKKENNKEK